MAKIFFITGKIGIGKSTLIKNCVEPYWDLFFGFYTQKVFSGYVSGWKTSVLAGSIVNMAGAFIVGTIYFHLYLCSFLFL